MSTTMPGFTAEAALSPSGTAYALSVGGVRRPGVDNVVLQGGRPPAGGQPPWWWQGRFVCVCDRYTCDCWWF
jgi:hypothetical protein